MDKDIWVKITDVEFEWLEKFLTPLILHDILNERKTVPVRIYKRLLKAKERRDSDGKNSMDMFD